MNNESTIELLLLKLKEDSISPKELKELILIFQNSSHNNELNQYLAKTWNNNAPAINDIQFSEDLLSKIHSKINTNISHDIKQPKNLVRSPKLWPILRYAAVFTTALGLSWWMNHLFTAKNNSSESSRKNEVAVSYGSKSRIVLPDGSVVNLNSGSKIRYASNFEHNRTVIMEGEAYFEVKKDAAHPFYVQTSNLTIRVLGTVFNVKSYPEENTIETTLVSGSVQIFENGSKSASSLKQIALLKPNQKAVFYKTKANGEQPKRGNPDNAHLETTQVPLHLKVESEIKTDLYTSWKDNKLVFNNEKFESIVPKLERWFNIEIENTYTELNSSRLTGKFDLETIEQALNALQIITPFKYSIEKNKIMIYRESKQPFKSN